MEPAAPSPLLFQTTIAVLGHVDSGKSTLLGSLASGMPDAEDGDRRSLVLTHAHEAGKGHTSDIAHVPVAWKAGTDGGPPVLVKSARAKNLRQIWESHRAAGAERMLKIVDLPGHETYLRTAVRGVVGSNPSMIMVVINGNRGVEEMTKEHLGIAMSLNIPFFIVVTKMDLAEKDRAALKDRMAVLSRMLRDHGRRRVMRVSNSKMMSAMVSAIGSDNLVPAFGISTRSGEGMDLLSEYMWHVCGAFRETVTAVATSLTMARIDGVRKNRASGWVITANVERGALTSTGSYVVGPYPDGKYYPFAIKRIEIGHEEVALAGAGSTIGISAARPPKAPSARSVRAGKCEWARAGMMILGGVTSAPPVAMTIRANVYLLSSQTTMEVGFTPHIHVGTTSQTMRVTKMVDAAGEDIPVMRLGDSGTVTFAVTQRPEGVEVGDKLVFCEGRARGIGRVIEISPEEDPVSEALRLDRKKRQREARSARRRGTRERRKKDEIAMAARAGRVFKAPSE